MLDLCVNGEIKESGKGGRRKYCFLNGNSREHVTYKLSHVKFVTQPRQNFLGHCLK